jgi:hypothetical protein
MRPFLPSWWMTAALISFRFLRRGEIYDSFDLGHVMGFTVGSTYFLQLLRNSPHNNHQFLAATAQQQLPTPHTTIIQYYW